MRCVMGVSLEKDGTRMLCGEVSDERKRRFLFVVFRLSIRGRGSGKRLRTKNAEPPGMFVSKYTQFPGRAVIR